MSTGLLEQEQWTAALVARDFQRSIDSMERKAQAFLHANGNSNSASSAHILPASETGPASKRLQNGGISALDKGAQITASCQSKDLPCLRKLRCIISASCVSYQHCCFCQLRGISAAPAVQVTWEVLTQPKHKRTCGLAARTTMWWLLF